MIQILQVKQFNFLANKRYEEAVKNYEFGKGGFPFRPMFVFKTPEGKDRQRGYVICKENSYKFVLTKKELNQF